MIRHMTNRNLAAAILCLTTFVWVLRPQSASATEARVTASQLAPFTVVSETGQALTEAGCVPYTFSDANQPITVQIGNEIPQSVIASDGAHSGGTTVWLCSREAVSRLTVQGQVAAVAQAQGLDQRIENADIPFVFDPSDAYQFGKFLGKNKEAVIEGGYQSFKLTTCMALGVLDPIGLMKCLAETVLVAADKVGSALVGLLFVGIKPLLVPGFLTNPFVKAGWPFVLGIANLGFILALLFIAALTILWAGGGFDVRRALVRLLIAAVLINFSLLIAGVILDVSRLFMAVIYRGMAGDSIANLPNHLLESTAFFKQAFYAQDHLGHVIEARVRAGIIGLLPVVGQGINAAFAADAFTPLVQLFIGVVLTWVLVIALLILLIGVLGRYIMLILLLIVSPLAYLFYAMPLTETWARRWWESFLKNVFYGPAVVFMLGLLARLGKDQSGIRAEFTNQFGEFWGEAGMLVLTIGMLIATVKVGKWVGGAAGSMITQQVEKVGGFARRHPILTGAIVAAPVAGPVGAVAAGGLAAAGVVSARALRFGERAAAHYVGAKAAEGFGGLGRILGKDVTGQELDKQDVEFLKKHKGWAFGTKLLERIVGGGGATDFEARVVSGAQALASARDLKARGASDADVKTAIRTSPHLEPYRVLPEIDDDFSPADTAFLAEHASVAQKVEMFKDPDIIKNLKKTPEGQEIIRKTQRLKTGKLKPKDKEQVRQKVQVETLKEPGFANLTFAPPDVSDKDPGLRAEVKKRLPEALAKVEKRRGENKEVKGAMKKGLDALAGKHRARPSPGKGKS